jgi:purine nucleosidase
MARKIIIDCDPGHDDAMAIMLAAGSPEAEIMAITTVAGNHSITETTRNAMVIADLAGLDDVPIAAGAARPLIRQSRWAEHIHGSTGLDGPPVRTTARVQDRRHAVDLIAEIVMSHPVGAITLVPTGPLTNIALAARMHPEIVSRVREVVFMGGAYADGNITPVAEFNVHTDPEAAHIVIGEEWEVTMVGLDLTHQAIATGEIRARIAGIGNEAGRFVTDLLDYVAQSYASSVERKLEPPVHDPCAVMRVIAPEVVEAVRANVEVELQGARTLGLTVTDFLGRDGAVLRTNVATRLDASEFWNRMIRALTRLPRDPAKS